MSGLIPHSPDRGGWLPDTVRLPDTEPEEERRIRRWQLRTAQWRALELAEAIFGPGAEAQLDGASGPGPFRGLLRLHVPFRDLDRHRKREDAFTRMAGSDEILRTLPLVFVFDPVPVAQGQE